MDYNENNGMVMPVGPMGYGGGYGYGNSFGGDFSWIVILFLFAMMSGFGGGFGGFGGGMGLYPWMNQVESTQAGFNQAATASGIAGIQNSLTSGFSSAEVAACNRAMDAMQTSYTNQIASMNQSFANQQALDTRLDTIAANQQECCCANQANTAELKYVVSTEAAANRAASTADTQMILDKLCQLELDGVRSDLEAERRQNATLQNQLNMAAFRADNVAQTAQLVADNTAQTQYLVNRISPYPQPAIVVGYGCNGSGWNNGFGWNGGFGGNFGYGFGVA